METLTTLGLIVLIIFGVLEIALFFKVWGMTNDVKDIKNRISLTIKTESEKEYDSFLNQVERLNPNNQAANPISSDFLIGETVEYPPMKRRMIVKSIKPDGKIECCSIKTNGKEEFEGVYLPEQIIHIVEN